MAHTWFFLIILLKCYYRLLTYRFFNLIGMSFSSCSRGSTLLSNLYCGSHIAVTMSLFYFATDLSNPYCTFWKLIQAFADFFGSKFSVSREFLLSCWILEIFFYWILRLLCDLSCCLSAGQGVWRWWFAYKQTSKKIALQTPFWVWTLNCLLVLYFETVNTNKLVPWGCECLTNNFS